MAWSILGRISGDLRVQKTDDPESRAVVVPTLVNSWGLPRARCMSGQTEECGRTVTRAATVLEVIRMLRNPAIAKEGFQKRGSEKVTQESDVPKRTQKRQIKTKAL